MKLVTAPQFCYISLILPFCFFSSDVAGGMKNGNAVATIRDSTARTPVTQTKIDKASSVASQNFKQEWKAPVDVPVRHITKHMSSLDADEREVVVTPRVARQAVDNLHE